MIKLEKAEVFNFEGAIRGMRNPMNSWDKSDSGLKIMNEDDYELGYEPNYEFIIGENDLKLMKNLIKAGPEHRKFLRQIFVSVDITAPLYWWKEFDTYKVGTVADSCSTMHKITDKEFTLNDFSCDQLLNIGCDLFTTESEGGLFSTTHQPMDLLADFIIPSLNICRNKFIETNNKDYWWQIIQLLPTSYNQKRTVTLNYEVLMSMYNQRKNHKLDEWRTFCEWIGSLPYAKELIINKTERIYRNEAQRNV
ncbi:hypothetical protein [Intestinibacter sp.]|uniref:hypothetical protein n=1 Tax=Intestinibacter sp. TaxID=1965304 RepID=UPI002A75E974|nr:hypothetical protein [Intestinibacter sp.]MDY2734514.1 hypothetical protein [Intestinibacter sp.]